MNAITEQTLGDAQSAVALEFQMLTIAKSSLSLHLFLFSLLLFSPLSPSYFPPSILFSFDSINILTLLRRRLTFKSRCTVQEKDRDGCPKIINLGSAKTDLFYERKKYGFKKR